MNSFGEIADLETALASEIGQETARQFVKVVQPCVAIKTQAASSNTKLGASRIGGCPSLPSQTAWPVRPIPQKIDEIVQRGGSNHERHIRRALSRELHYEFLLQVNLSEASAVMPESGLPGEGRLLFFCDLETVPWNNGRSSCRVLWDKTPDQKLILAELPDDIQQRAVESADDYNREAKKYDLPTDRQPGQTSYFTASQGLQLSKVYRFPHPYAFEVQACESLKEALKRPINDDETVSEKYMEFLGDNETPGSHNQFLGLPYPDQDDPRYDAVVIADYKRHDMPSEEWQKEFSQIYKASQDWRLLLQFELTELHSSHVGILFFLMHKEQLAAHNFDEVLVIYQQT